MIIVDWLLRLLNGVLRLGALAWDFFTPRGLLGMAGVAAFFLIFQFGPAIFGGGRAAGTSQVKPDPLPKVVLDKTVDWETRSAHEVRHYKRAAIMFYRLDYCTAPIPGDPRCTEETVQARADYIVFREVCDKWFGGVYKQLRRRK